MVHGEESNQELQACRIVENLPDRLKDRPPPPNLAALREQAPLRVGSVICRFLKRGICELQEVRNHEYEPQERRLPPLRRPVDRTERARDHEVQDVQPAAYGHVRGRLHGHESEQTRQDIISGVRGVSERHAEARDAHGMIKSPLIILCIAPSF